MGMNETPQGERIHIGFFGRRNAGKSSLVNAVTGQELAVVSDIKGTTTDPVYKSMELLPLGPVVIIDTPGYDDEGALGELRVQKTRQILKKTDLAVLVRDASEPEGSCEQELISLFREQELPFLVVYNKCDLLREPSELKIKENEICVSALKRQQIQELKERIARLAPEKKNALPLAADLIKPGDLAVLVTPIDSAAPKGRLILPQQQVIRDLIDRGGAVLVVKEDGLLGAFDSLGKKPALVITDSQVFERVNRETPADIPLTSFSILMARHKGILDVAVSGAAAIDRLKDGDQVLIAEGCTHHRQCGDIGTQKLPGWLRAYTGKELHFAFCSGTEFPEDLSSYALVLHCGGCMLGEREVQNRMKSALAMGVPMTNYGVAIAHVHGILKRSISLFPHLLKLLSEEAD